MSNVDYGGRTATKLCTGQGSRQARRVGAQGCRWQGWQAPGRYSGTKHLPNRHGRRKEGRSRGRPPTAFGKSADPPLFLWVPASSQSQARRLLMIYFLTHALSRFTLPPLQLSECRNGSIFRRRQVFFPRIPFSLIYFPSYPLWMKTNTLLLACKGLLAALLSFLQLTCTSGLLLPPFIFPFSSTNL